MTTLNNHPFSTIVADTLHIIAQTALLIFCLASISLALAIMA